MAHMQSCAQSRAYGQKHVDVMPGGRATQTSLHVWEVVGPAWVGGRPPERTPAGADQAGGACPAFVPSGQTQNWELLGSSVHIPRGAAWRRVHS